jgi:hypothetical protein
MKVYGFSGCERRQWWKIISRPYVVMPFCQQKSLHIIKIRMFTSSEQYCTDTSRPQSTFLWLLRFKKQNKCQWHSNLSQDKNTYFSITAPHILVTFNSPTSFRWTGPFTISPLNILLLWICYYKAVKCWVHMLLNVILFKGYDKTNREWLNESWAVTRYVSEISINTITYHHSRFLIVTPRFESLERRSVSFQIAKLFNSLISMTTSKKKKSEGVSATAISQFERDRTCVETRSSLRLRKISRCVMLRCVNWSRRLCWGSEGWQVRWLIQNFPDWRSKNHKTHHKAYWMPSPSKYFSPACRHWYHSLHFWNASWKSLSVRVSSTLRIGLDLLSCIELASFHLQFSFWK